MIIDSSPKAHEFAQGRFDACVVGSGPAGITVARKLAASGLSVALMEGGGLDFDQTSQDLYVGDCIGRDYYSLDSTRLRFFGGTSNHWGGRCRALEPWDFQARAYLGEAGWPISKADLDPFAAEADDIVSIPPADAYPDSADELAGEDFRIIRFRHSPPTRFNEKYREELRASSQITLVLNANLVDLELDDGLGTVTGAVFKTYDSGDPGFVVRAKVYCLCMGGLENPRFLLNATRQVPHGIGNEHDLVGRGFCEHPAYSIGKVLFEGDAPTPREYEPTAELLERQQIANFNLLLSTKARSLSKEVARNVICSTEFSLKLARAVFGRAVNCDAGGVDTYLSLRQQDSGVGGLGLITEQVINPDSRVMLSDQTDMFGLRRIALDWRLSDIDLRTMRTACMDIAERFAASGTGRVQLKDWVLAEHMDPPQLGTGNGEVGLHHHMCTTRMSSDPALGVVNADCRLHSVSNLYVGGCSVFASAGHANPTYTIVQLALRLGTHLSQTVKA